MVGMFTRVSFRQIQHINLKIVNIDKKNVLQLNTSVSKRFETHTGRGVF